MSLESIAKPVGCLNSASIPGPSTSPPLPDPARVVAVAAPDPGSKVIFLILWVPSSATNKFPAESKTISLICLNLAWFLSPSASPQPSPIT